MSFSKRTEMTSRIVYWLTQSEWLSYHLQALCPLTRQMTSGIVLTNQNDSLIISMPIDAANDKRNCVRTNQNDSLIIYMHIDTANDKRNCTDQSEWLSYHLHAHWRGKIGIVYCPPNHYQSDSPIIYSTCPLTRQMASVIVRTYQNDSLFIYMPMDAAKNTPEVVRSFRKTKQLMNHMQPPANNWKELPSRSFYGEQTADESRLSPMRGCAGQELKRFFRPYSFMKN
jgi:hypothetical protein